MYECMTSLISQDITTLLVSIYVQNMLKYRQVLYPFLDGPVSVRLHAGSGCCSCIWQVKGRKLGA